ASAALLERAGVLQVLELHEHVGAGHQRKRLRVRRGRANDGTLDRRVGVAYVVRSYRQRHAVMVRASYEMSWPTAWMTSPARPPTTVPLIRMNCRSRPSSSSRRREVSSPSQRAMVPLTSCARSSWKRS